LSPPFDRSVFINCPFERAVGRVRTWLVAQAGAERIGPARILGMNVAFQEWFYERELAAGSSEDDIKEYPTVEMISAMHEWMNAGQPT